MFKILDFLQRHGLAARFENKRIVIDTQAVANRHPDLPFDDAHEYFILEIMDHFPKFDVTWEIDGASMLISASSAKATA